MNLTLFDKLRLMSVPEHEQQIYINDKIQIQDDN